MNNKLEDIKVLLELPIDDTTDDKVLNILYKDTEQHILNYLGVDEFPENLRYIITNIVVARFGVIGSEHLKTSVISDISETYSNAGSDYLKPYYTVLDTYLDRQEDIINGSTTGSWFLFL